MSPRKGLIPAVVTAEARLLGSDPARASSWKDLDLGGKTLLFCLTVVPLSGLIGSGFGHLRLASFSTTAIIGFATTFVCWTVVATKSHLPASSGRVAAAFLLFLLSCVGSACVGIVTRQGVQYLQVLVGMLGALCLGAAIRASAGAQIETVVAACVRITSVVLLVAFTAGALGARANFDTRPSAIVALLALAWFLAEAQRSHRKSSLWWAAAVLAGIGASLSRTALVAGLIVGIGSLILASRGHRLRGLLIGVVFVVGGAWAVTSWAPLHNRFFSGDLSLSVGGVQVNTEGRSYVWGTLWSEVPNDLILGHGPGAASRRSVQLESSFDQPHNDYLRLVYDFGIVGSLLFGWLVVRTAQGLLHARRKSPRAVAPVAAINAGIAILIVMVTDNPLDYPFVMIPLGALVGIGLGAAYAESPYRRRNAHPLRSSATGRGGDPKTTGFDAGVRPEASVADVPTGAIRAIVRAATGAPEAGERA